MTGTSVRTYQVHDGMIVGRTLLTRYSMRPTAAPLELLLLVQDTFGVILGLLQIPIWIELVGSILFKHHTAIRTGHKYPLVSHTTSSIVIYCHHCIAEYT